MEKSVGIRELKQNPSKVLADVKAGDTVAITERGVKIARIVPVSPSPLEEMILAGEVTVPTGNLKAALDQITPIAPEPGTPSIQERLDWSRGYTDDD
jgi:prevent-host-death family protein